MEQMVEAGFSKVNIGLSVWMQEKTAVEEQEGKPFRCPSNRET